MHFIQLCSLDGLSHNLLQLILHRWRINKFFEKSYDLIFSILKEFCYTLMGEVTFELEGKKFNVRQKNSEGNLFVKRADMFT